MNHIITKITTIQTLVRFEFKDDSLYYYRLCLTHIHTHQIIYTCSILLLLLLFNNHILLLSFSHIYEQHVHELSFTKALYYTNRKKKITHNEYLLFLSILLSILSEVIINLHNAMQIY
jgi:hypothetical protein